jgi:dihydrodipicolinate synthase/N-acetylneuraminate lyase
VAVMKEAMEILGMPAGPVRPPLTNCRSADKAELASLMTIYSEMRQATAMALFRSIDVY